MIRVLIDGRVSARDGIGRYTTCLVGALRAAAGPDIHIAVLAPTGTPRYSLAEGTELARAAGLPAVCRAGPQAQGATRAHRRLPVQPR